MDETTMEEEKPPRPGVGSTNNMDRNIHSLPALGVRYTQLCRKLNMDDELSRRGWVLLQRLVFMDIVPDVTEDPKNITKEYVGRIWSSCCIFVVGVFQARGPQSHRMEVQGTGIKLNSLLKCTGITVGELFNNVELVMRACGPGLTRAFDAGFTSRTIDYIINVVTDCLQHLKHNYVVMTVFFEKFTFLWDISRNFAGTLDRQSASLSENAFSFAWLLFVVARHRLFGWDHLALANLYSLLVATINYARFGFDNSIVTITDNEMDPDNSDKMDVTTGETEESKQESKEQPKEEAVKEKDNEDQAKKSELCSGGKKLARFAKVELRDVTEMGVSLIDLVHALVKEGVLGSYSLDKGTGASYLSSPVNTEKLSRFYDNRYILSVCDFDERVFLDPRLHRQLATTPQRPKSDSSETKQVEGASALHRGGKESKNPESKPIEAKLSKRQLFTDNANYGTVYSSTKTAALALSRSPGNETSQSIHSSPMKPRITKSPAPMGTPVSGAVEANNWLRRELQDAPDKPSNTLCERYFRECENNPEESIVKRLEDFRVKLSKQYAESGPAGVINFDDAPREKPALSSRLHEHLILVNKLYYRTLESILRGESERLKTNNFNALLNNEKFHRSLYVWCLEVILRSKEIFKLMYPKSAKIINVGNLDLIKIVDCFIKYVPALPRVSRQHVYSIEENIMEEAAWRSDSINQIMSIMSSDKSKKSPQQNLFLRKLYTLAHNRIRKLCFGLFSAASTTELMRLTLSTFRHAVSRYPELLKDRHVDHLILCSIYGIGKIKSVKPNVSFKRINSVYKSQHSNDPHSYNKVIREIVLAPAPASASTSKANTETSSIPPTPPIPYKQQQAEKKSKKGDVIKFYNQVFLPKMKRYLLDLKHSSSQGASSTPKSGTGVGSFASTPKGLQTPTKSAQSPGYATNAAVWIQSPHKSVPSPHRLSGSNIYLSPRRTTRDSPARMTPMTRALYAFGESPARDLHLINRAVTSQRRSRLRRGPGLDDDDTQGVQSAKRARIDRISSLLRSSEDNNRQNTPEKMEEEKEE